MLLFVLFLFLFLLPCHPPWGLRSLPSIFWCFSFSEEWVFVDWGGGCSRVISMLAFGLPTHNLLHRVAGLVCHSLAVHPPRFRAQSKLPFQPRLRSSATAMIQLLLLALCWFGNKITRLFAIKVSVILIISHHQPV